MAWSLLQPIRASLSFSNIADEFDDDTTREALAPQIKEEARARASWT